MNDQLNLAGIWKMRQDPANDLAFAGTGNDFDWENTIIPAPAGTEGATVWFRRHFRIPAAWRGRQLYLACEGAGYAPAVWINGHPAGRNRSGWFPFEFPIGALVLPDRENTITLRLNGRDGKSGALWGGIKILARNTVSIRLLRASTCPDGCGGALVTVTAGIRNADRRPHTLDFTCSVGPESGEDGKVVREHRSVAVTDRYTEISVTAAVPEPRFWWTHDRGAAEQYTATVLVSENGRIADESQMLFGIRFLGRGERGRWLLNGLPLPVRGTVVNDDDLPMSGDIESCRALVDTIKKAGYNAVRTGSITYGTGLYHACSRAGLLVWQALPGGGVIPDTRALEFLGHDTVSLVNLLGGFPALAAWYCGNDLGTGGNFLRNTAVAADPVRPVGTEGGWWSPPGSSGTVTGFSLIDTIEDPERGRLALERSRSGTDGHESCGCFSTTVLAANTPSMAPLLITPECPVRSFAPGTGDDMSFFEKILVVNDRNEKYTGVTCRVVLTAPDGSICAETVCTAAIAPGVVTVVYRPEPQWRVGGGREPGVYRLSCALLAADGRPLARNGTVLTVEPAKTG